ncbi:MAG: hypothetical protein KGN02_11090 [bacterium]|nr:hypothetical protein [bacterium]
MKIHIMGILAAFALASSVALAADVRPLAGSIVMARAGSSPIFLWNATDYVAKLVSDKVLGDDGMHALEATAVTGLAQKVASSSAATVAIRVVYAKTGAVSPVYGTPTFTGMENVLTISAPRGALVKNAGPWATQLADGKVPAGVKIVVSGKLPPPQ